MQEGDRSRDRRSGGSEVGGRDKRTMFEESERREGVADEGDKGEFPAFVACAYENANSLTK